jgi:hypothetical protein
MISPLAPHPITRFLSHTGVLALAILLAYVLALPMAFVCRICGASIIFYPACLKDFIGVVF